jgi:hypothetical protein
VNQTLLTSGRSGGGASSDFSAAAAASDQHRGPCQYVAAICNFRLAEGGIETKSATCSGFFRLPVSESLGPGRGGKSWPKFRWTLRFTIKVSEADILEPAVCSSSRGTWPQGARINRLSAEGPGSLFYLSGSWGGHLCTDLIVGWMFVCVVSSADLF